MHARGPMKKKANASAEKPKKATNPRGHAGAQGSKEPPKGDEHGAKWRGGGKKGEDE